MSCFSRPNRLPSLPCPWQCPHPAPGAVGQARSDTHGILCSFHPETTSPDPFRPWNLGKLIGRKPPLKLREVWAIRIRLQIQERLRDLAMFNLAIDSKLRGCDLVALRVDDVLPSGRVRPRTTVIQKKAGRPVQFEITEQTRETVMHWITKGGRRPGGYLFPSRIGKNKPLATRRHARLMDGWVTSIGLDPALYGTHSLRRTKGGPDPPAHRQSPGGPAPARPHQAGEHGPLSRHRGG